MKKGVLGSAVLELINKNNIEDVKVQIFGYEDTFVEHGSVDELEEKYGLSAQKIANEIQKNFAKEETAESIEV